MKRIATSFIVIVVVLAVSGPSWGGAPSAPTKVLGTHGAQEFNPAANDTYLVWSSNSVSRPRHYDAWSQPLDHSAAPSKMNAPKTLGYTGGSLNGNEATFQQVTFGSRVTHSNVYFDDVTTDTVTNPPAGINTTDWEWSASSSPGFILFGRNQFRTNRSPWKVILYDRNLTTFTTLDSVKNRCGCIYPGTVTDSYATWTKCNTFPCQVYVYDIVGQSTTVIPNPLLKQQYAGSVATDSGAFYYVRSGNRCGQSVRLMRLDVGSLTPVVIASLAGGIDANSTFAFTDGLSADHVYYSQYDCAANNFDIYVVDNAQLLSGARATGSSGRAGGAIPLRGTGLARP